MNKAKLKSYAPQARKDFIAAVTARANLLGLSEKAGKLEVAPSQPQGDVSVIAGQAWPVKVHSQREQLIIRIQKDGFAQTMEAVAYTWFNRFAALRYMELHEYLGHGHRALSSQEGTLPDILTHATDLAKSGGLPGLKPALVAEMKLAGNRDSELYRMLLVAQCNELSNAMPFLFERIDDETELLLPENLLRTDSVIAKLVGSIAEDDWKEVEIIGWLYQFYISEKKEEVIGKVVKSEDIPAATQLFTPKWIVQYLVQNSIGRLWLMANPASTLKTQWQFYIEPATQTAEMQEQLDALMQARVNEDNGSLHPESITLLDPACGSGHILVEAYEVLKAIYLERGYQPRSIPRLILEKNLYGLDIDDRAAQMAGFALLMKARADDRRLFNEPIKLNVLSLQESTGMDANQLILSLKAGEHWNKQQIVVNASTSGFGADHLFTGSLPQSSFGNSIVVDTVGDPVLVTIATLVATFAHAKTFGSLIQIPQELNGQLVVIAERLQLALQNGDLYAKAAAQDLWPLVAQAKVLGMQFDGVVANPPYMGNKGMNGILKDFAGKNFPNSRTDLFSMFIERGFSFCKTAGFNNMITMDAWMFSPAYTEFRQNLLQTKTFTTCAHFGSRAFDSISGEIVSTVAFSSINFPGKINIPVYLRLVAGRNEKDKSQMILAGSDRYQLHTQEKYFNIIGTPLAYWLAPRFIEMMKSWKKLGDLAEPRSGLTTGNNDKFLRNWYEVPKINFSITDADYDDSVFDRWVPLNGGSAFRKWYGSNLAVINWEHKGLAIKNNPGATIANSAFQFKPGVTWSKISGSSISARRTGHGFMFSAVGLKAFPSPRHINFVCGLLNSNIVQYLVPVFSSNLTILSGDIAKYPVPDNIQSSISDNVENLCRIAKGDWDSYEISWDFNQNPLIIQDKSLLSEAYKLWATCNKNAFIEMQRLEEMNNKQLIELYGLDEDLSPAVPESKITLTRADGEKDCQHLISYAVGCMMGRYSLDVPGLVYAQAGNVGFDIGPYETFHADTDGIVPLTDELWFEDDAASRVREFLLVVWGADTLAANMAWLAESLGTKASETADETVRRYLAEKFYKDHLQTYKKRPIYWLFSSGKQGAFQALVYLHRYQEGTLARMRAEYVVPLTGKIQSRIDMLQKDAAATSSTAARNKLAKEVEKLKKKHVELLAYDEQLRHYADMRITLDLDDGVKVNYAKFGDLLAEVKAVTGGASDD